MQITFKGLVISSLILLVIGYAIGRYTTPTKVKIEKEYVQVDKKQKDIEQNKSTDLNHNKNTRTIITETVLPDGTKQVKTVIIEHDKTKRETDTNKKVHEKTTQVVTDKTSKEIENRRPLVSFGVLGGFDVRSLFEAKPLIGGYVNKNVLGPITVGAWGLSNGTCGVSLGLQF